MLRFYGYYKEAAVESNDEKERIRKLMVYFYLEDNSIQLIEEKQMNSGIPQGCFLHRKKVLRADESKSFLSVYDFMIG